MANELFWMVLKLDVLTDSWMYGNFRLLELFSFKFLCAVAVKLECFIFGKVRCWRMSVCAYACVSVLLLLPACVRLNRSSSLPCFWKSEGRCCSIGRLCMTLMNTLIGPHEDRPDRDRLICVYCALWLDERDDVMTAVSHCDRAAVHSLKCAI